MVAPLLLPIKTLPRRSVEGAASLSQARDESVSEKKLIYSIIFRESYREVHKMLNQNIAPKLHASEEFHAAMASYVMRTEEDDDGEA